MNSTSTYQTDSKLRVIEGMSFGTTSILSDEGVSTRYILVIETEEERLNFFFDPLTRVDQEVMNWAAVCINDFTDLVGVDNVDEI